LKFLGRAKKFWQDLGTEPPGKTQYFNVACAGGHRVRGERTEGYQALRCPVCGEGVFVLPRSPLPEPVAPDGAPQARGAAGRARNVWTDEGPVELTDPARGAVEVDHDGAGRGDAEIVWDDEPAEASPRAGAPASAQIAPEDFAAAEIDAVRRAVARGAEVAPARPGRARPDGGVPGDRPRRELAAQPGPARAVRSRPKPAEAPASAALEARPGPRPGPRIGLIFFLLTLLIAATVGWRVWMNRRAQYPLIIERGKVEGIAALEDGDFDRANQLLSAARSAVDALGGHVTDADEIRQAADEASIFVNICPKTLEELLAEAVRTNPEAWASTFDSLYKGRACVFDTIIESTPEESESGSYELAYVVFPPGEASRFGDGRNPPSEPFARIDLAGFEAIEKAGLKRGDHITFGAKLQSIVYDAGRKHRVVRLEPKSGVVITHQRALLAIGWPSPQTVDLPQEDQP
jgi:hypothetical protein